MGSNKQTTTQTRDPYAPSKPLFDASAGIVNDYLKNPNSTAVYDGKRSVDMSGMTKQGLDGLANNGGFDQAKDYYTKSLNGDYLNPNGEYVQGLQKAVQSSVMPGVNSTFAKSGMMGSTLHQGTLERSLTDGMAAPLFSNYQNERQNQSQAAQMLPQIYGADAQAKVMAGQLGEGYQKEKMAADWQKWQEQQDAPLLALKKTFPYTQAIGGAGGTSTSTTEQSQSPWATAAGIGMAGLGMASGLGGMGMMGGGFTSPWSSLMGGGWMGKQATNQTDGGSYNMPKPSGWGW